MINMVVDAANCFLVDWISGFWMHVGDERSHADDQLHITRILIIQTSSPRNYFDR